jgi:PAS domain-containing protein
MQATEPLPLYHSWPIAARAGHFAQGMLIDDDVMPVADIGRWHCALPDNALTWDPTVFELFGLSRDVVLTRPLAVACYAEESRAAMERLRAHAIRYQRGFTLDVEVGPPAGRRRWLRLIAAPIVVGKRVVALEGLKIPLAA